MWRRGPGWCARGCPHEDRPGRRRTHVWTVKATKQAVIELADHLRGLQIQIVTLECTSDYWRVWCVVLEAAGLKVQLVNARHVKNVPGRAKTDKKDCGVAGQADRAGPAAAVIRAAAGDPAAAGVTPGCAPTWSASGPGTGRGWRSCWNGALIKISAVFSKLDHRYGAGDDRGADRRAAEPEDPGGAWPSAGMQQAGRAGRGAGRDCSQPHHSELARILLDQIDALTVQIDALTDPHRAS